METVDEDDQERRPVECSVVDVGPRDAFLLLSS